MLFRSGALLTADGAGSSAFVATRTVTHVLTNDVSKTSWSTNSIQQLGNVNSTPLPSWSIAAGATYRLEYLVHYEMGATNAGLVHGVVFDAPLGVSLQQQVGYGLAASTVNVAPSLSGMFVQTTATQAFINFVVGIAASSQTNRVLTGQAIFRSETNANMVFSYAPANNTTNTVVIKAGTTISLTQIAP